MKTWFVSRIFSINFSRFKWTRIINLVVTHWADTSPDTGYPVKGVQFDTEWILTASRGHFFHYCQCVFVIGFKVAKKRKRKINLVPRPRNGHSIQIKRSISFEPRFLYSNFMYILNLQAKIPFTAKGRINVCEKNTEEASDFQ